MEADTDRRSSEGLWVGAGAGAAVVGIADIDGGMDERRLLCLYVGEPSITE